MPASRSSTKFVSAPSTGPGRAVCPSALSPLPLRSSEVKEEARAASGEIAARACSDDEDSVTPAPARSSRFPWSSATARRRSCASDRGSVVSPACVTASLVSLVRLEIPSGMEPTPREARDRSRSRVSESSTGQNPSRKGLPDRSSPPPPSGAPAASRAREVSCGGRWRRAGSPREPSHSRTVSARSGGPR